MLGTSVHIYHLIVTLRGTISWLQHRAAASSKKTCKVFVKQYQRVGFSDNCNERSVQELQACD